MKERQTELFKMRGTRVEEDGLGLYAWFEYGYDNDGWRHRDEYIPLYIDANGRLKSEETGKTLPTVERKFLEWVREDLPQGRGRLGGIVIKERPW